MCYGGPTFGKLSPFLDPIGGITGKYLSPAMVDPGGSLVGAAVKATGVKGTAGGVLNAFSGLQGTLEQGKYLYNQMQPKAPPAAAPAPAAPATTSVMSNPPNLAGPEQFSSALLAQSRQRVLSANQPFTQSGLLTFT